MSKFDPATTGKIDEHKAGIMIILSANLMRPIMIKCVRPLKESFMRLIILILSAIPMLLASQISFLSAEEAKKQQIDGDRPCAEAIQESPTFPDLVRDLVNLGVKADHRNGAFTGKLASLLDLPNGTIPRGGGLDKQSTEDYLKHIVEVILDRSSKESKVSAMIFTTVNEIEKVGDETYYFRIAPDGKLEKVVTISGPNDADNNAIRGAGHAAVLDLNDPEVRYRFQHEMDFWLKNMYRRKKTPQSNSTEKAAAGKEGRR